MAAIDSLNPAAATVVKLFSSVFRSAPTADIVTWGAGTLHAGGTPASLLDFMFNLSVPQSPFTAYAPISTDTAFCRALVDNLVFGSTIDAAKTAAWVSEITTWVGRYASRGAFAAAIVDLVATTDTTDADLLAVRSLLASRAETAAVYAQSPAGAVYDGLGFGQLMEPLAPATYQLSANPSFDEGSSVTLTLQTTHVAPGTILPFHLSGTGITASDIVGGLLTGQLVVDSNGLAHATIVLASDATTEGPETLHAALDNGRGQVDLSIADTSRTPLPTYALSVDRDSQDEGGNLVFTLTTTQVPAGSVLTYTLSGTGITAADIVGGQLTGSFTVDAAGVGVSTVRLVADATTEGAETLRLRLSGDAASIEALIRDSSVTPPPVGAADLLVIGDRMDNSGAGVPPSALDGEIKINTYLNADLLNQSGTVPLRMSVADLRATGTVAGAALVTTNHSADRGNIPQASNQSLFSFDLGLLTDRVDYSAESGRIVAVVSPVSTVVAQYVLINDDALDNVFNNATDRIDTLKGVEELVASTGGGVIDLSQSGRDWTINYGVNFNLTADVDLPHDREQRRIVVTDASTGQPLDRSFIEYRDAGFNAAVAQPRAAWRVVEGSDRNETIVFTSVEAMDERASHLRGGVNTVKFNELTRSILVNLGITPWVASTSLADDTNASGVVTATTSFTNGDGVTLLGAHSNITTSNTPDNAIAAGTLKLAGSQDAEDLVNLASTNAAQLITLGKTVSGSDLVGIRLLSGPAVDALELTGFERLRDNGATDDVFVVEHIARAISAGPHLIDGLGDHDTVRLATEALGSAAVGGLADTIDLSLIDSAAVGFDTDFDVLDIRNVDGAALTVLGTAGTDDELVLGPLSTVRTVSQFESVVLTDASTDRGAALTLDLDAGAVKSGATKLFDFGGYVLSAGGTVFGSTGQPSPAAPVATGMSLSVIDSSPGSGAVLWGGSAGDVLAGAVGNDTLRGGGGNDTLSGGLTGETWAFQLGGSPDASALAGHRITITMTIDGTALTLTEAAAADTVYGDGNGAVVDGAPLATIGTAMAALVNANLAAINAGPGTGRLVDANYNPSTGAVLLSFAPGVDANDVVSFGLNSGVAPDSGSFSLSAGPHLEGGNGGADTFVFEASGALNGSDTVIDFTRASDKLRMTAFTGGAIGAFSAPINAALGGSFAGVSTTGELIFNKAGGLLSAADFSASAAAGKFVLADGARCVVAVTADPTGAQGDAANTPVRLYYVTNGADAGTSDLTVSLVASISGPDELSLADIVWGLG